VRLLTVNAGSTSMKVATVRGEDATSHGSLDAALAGPRPDAVAHRVVHGGERTGPAIIDDALDAELEELTDLAPLHQPPALEAIGRCRRAWPDVANVACFDTAFHTTVPEAARTYALPARLRQRVKVYGFHGLSHAWAVGRLAALAPTARRVVVAHLGGGQSLCAALDGRSVMTTMGMAPLDGLVMGTRSGDVGPGALLWLQRHGGDDLDGVLERESGLLGLCGEADMRAVHRRMANGDDDARLAFAVWRHRAVTLLGGCVAALGGLDALVFTGGIGEHDRVARAAICGAFGWLGLTVVESPGLAEGEREVTGPDASVRTFVVPSREDLQLAREAAELVHPT
jgi:acetate kinase